MILKKTNLTTGLSILTEKLNTLKDIGLLVSCQKTLEI